MSRRSAGKLGLAVVEASGLLAILVAVLWQSAYGELGLEVDRYFHLQWLALAAFCGLLWQLADARNGDLRVSDRWLGYVKKSTAIERWGWFWMASALVSALVSVDRGRSLLGATPRLGGLASELAVLGLGLVLAHGWSRSEARDRAEQALILAAAWLVGYGWLQVVGLDPVVWQETWQGRPISTQGNPLFLGQLLVLLTPLLVSRVVWTWREGRARASAAAFSLAASAVGLLAATRARGALLGLVVAAVIWIAFVLASSKNRRRRQAALAVVLISVLAAGLSFLAWMPRAQGAGGTVAQRLLLWQAVVEMVGESSPARLLIGYGQESLALVVPPHLPRDLPGRLWNPDLYHDRAHNLALDALLARGLVGVLAGLGLLVGGMLAAARLVRRRAEGNLSEAEAFRVIGLAAGIAGHSAALLTGVLTAAGSFVSWVALALLAGTLRSEEAPEETRRSKRAKAEAEARLHRLRGAVMAALVGIVLALAVFAVWVPEQVGELEPMGGPAITLVVAVLAGVLGWASGPLFVATQWRGDVRFVLLWLAVYLFAHGWMLSRPHPGVGVVVLTELGLLVGGAILARSLVDQGPSSGVSRGRARTGLAAAATLILMSVAIWGPGRGILAGVELKEGRSALVRGDLAMAFERLETARDWAPWLDDASLSLVRAWLRKAESERSSSRRDEGFSEALAELSVLAERHPLSALYAIELGYLHARWADGSSPSLSRERFLAAEAHFRRALGQDPQNAAAHRSLGATLLDLGRGVEAVEELEESVRLAPRSLESRLLLGRALLETGRIEEGLASLSDGRELDPRRTRALLEGLVRARRQDASALRDFAALEIVEGRKESALAILQAAMEIASPEQVGVLVRLASIAGQLP